MGTKKNRGSKSSRRGIPGNPAIPARAAPDRPLFILACIGAVLTGFLLWNDFTSGVLPYCESNSGCDIVQNSRWSNFLSIRLSAWGLAAYTAIGLCAVLPTTASKRRRWSSFWVSIGLGVSVYLTVVSIVILQTICIYCVLSLLIMTSAFVLGFFPAELRTKPSLRLAGLSLGMAVALLMQFDADGIFDGSDISADPYLRELAEYLTQRGAKFYGASWCHHCQDQKELFGYCFRFTLNQTIVTKSSTY